MGKTSSAAKNRWSEKTYKKVTICLRKVEDADLIQWLEQNKEQYSLTEIFRIGIKQVINGSQNNAPNP